MRKFYVPLLFVSFLVASFGAIAQRTLTGSVLDEQSKESLVSANVVLRFVEDTTKFVFATTDTEGNFSFSNLTQNKYLLQISYVGYQQHEQLIALNGQNTTLAPILLEAKQLQQVVVQGQQVISEQIGDTVQYNANAFKTEKNANAEDLIRKMPTITTENGKIKAQGEEVQEVLVDGKPFFGNDPNAALKNLPADVIEKIQVFDKVSDQERFTGIQSGNTVKTINIITKKDRRSGQFGKIYGGYGTDNRYITGGNINFFNDDQRISVIGLSNNVSQQNFADQDLVGALGGGSRRPRWRRSNGNPNDIDNFLVNQQNGITQTNSFGINYTDEIGKKITLTGSYFYNISNNDAFSNLNRDFFLEDNQLYTEKETATNQNQNHRLFLRMEYKINENNEVILTPRANMQLVDNQNQSIARTLLNDTLTLNRTENRFLTNSMGFNFENDALWRHKFGKDRRTFSFNLNTKYNLQDGESNLIGFTETLKTIDTLNQETFINNNDLLWETQFNYTEPIGNKSTLEVRYSMSNNTRENDTETFDIFSDERIINSLLSNRINSDYMVQESRLTYNYRSKKLMFNTGFEYQYAVLDGGQRFPSETHFERTFSNVLPRMFLRYNFSENSSIRLIYRTSTRAPEISQLQEVVNNSNPVQLTVGNEDLVQQIDSRYIVRYSYNNPDKRFNIFAFAFANQSNNFFSNATWIAQQDSLSVDGIVLEEGVQLTRPVNVDGYWNTRTFLTFGFPIWKLNLSINNQFNYSRTPTFINDRKNIANNYVIQEGISLSSNISEKIDFSLGYNLGYNIVENTIQPQANNNFLIHTADFRNTFLFGKGFLWQNDVSYQSYNGLNDAFNQDFLLWTMSVGKRFLKDERGEIKLTIFDLLNQNTSIARNVTETYVEDTQTNVLKQYFLVNFTYMLRNFKSKKEQAAEIQRQQHRDGRGRGYQNRGR